MNHTAQIITKESEWNNSKHIDQCFNSINKIITTYVVYITRTLQHRKNIHHDSAWIYTINK